MKDVLRRFAADDAQLTAAAATTCSVVVCAAACCVRTLRCKSCRALPKAAAAARRRCRVCARARSSLSLPDCASHSTNKCAQIRMHQLMETGRAHQSHKTHKPGGGRRGIWFLWGLKRPRGRHCRFFKLQPFTEGVFKERGRCREAGGWF